MQTTQVEDEVEDFLDRISRGPEIQAGETVDDSELMQREETCFHHATHWATQQNFAELESDRSPLVDFLADPEAEPAPKRRSIRSDEAHLVVQRPIPFKATSVSFDADEQRYRLEVHDLDWYNRILERYVDAGYGPRSDSLGNVASIVGIFQSLPSDLADVVKEGLDALHVLRAARATSRRPLAAAAPASEWTGRLAAIEDDMWEHNDQCGYLRFEWDPVTERRRYGIA
jgi:hypothetical protein